MSSATHTAISPFARLRDWMAFEHTDIWVIFIYSSAIGLLSLVVPIATQSLVNTIAFGTLLQPLLVLSLLVLLGLACAAILKALRSHVVEVMQRRIFVRVSAQSLQKLLRVRTEAFDDGHGPELVNRFFDVVTLQKGGATLLVEGLEVMIATFIGMILLATYHPLLMVFALLLLASVFIVLFPLGIGAVRTAVQESKAKYSIAAWLQEIARHPASFKSAPAAQYAVDRANDLVGEYLKYRRLHWRILLRQIGASLTLQAIGGAAVLGAGGWLVMERQLTLGQLVAAELVVASALNSFSKFGKQLETFYDMLAAVDKLGYLTDLPVEHDGHEVLRGEGGASLEIRDVSFHYGPNSGLIEKLRLTIKPGMRLGISGKSGSGKSTLIDLMYGFREPVQGALLLDGHEYRNLKLYDLRRQIALARVPEVFHGTLEDNIRTGNKDLSSAELRAILDQAGLLEVVDGLPNGLKTELATGGLPLTVGQTIRLMIARAIALRPRVLILDEILDRLEDGPIREKLVKRLIDKANPWTVILVSQSETVLRHCDRIITLEDGNIREHNHEN